MAQERRQLIDAHVLLVSAALTSAILGSYKLYTVFLRPIQHVTHINQRAFRSQWLHGKVTSVGDGDNFHFFHTPGGIIGGWGWLRQLPRVNQRGLRHKTLHVRLCGIDAPERAHFGKPAQPYGDEAMAWLRSFILGRNIRVKPLSLDQYGRVVGKAMVRGWFGWKDVSQEMLKAGWCIVYEGKSSAEFDGCEELYRMEEAKSRKAKRGMFQKKVVQTPGQYKREHKIGEQ
ncbi:putative endonuclease LCL3 [Cyberlindnera fabianii]|uniref:Probable endonuclease LCL3 n=1 Tax=Cyberlindnera fabianii TaxID=36022 RepID=A0A1V2L2C8_CYBFA|nr:putative endonuclease LCL3 [Cyberlindnera fabianii]